MRASKQRENQRLLAVVTHGLGEQRGQHQGPVLATKQVHRQLRTHTSAPTSTPEMNNGEAQQAMVMKG